MVGVCFRGVFFGGHFDVVGICVVGVEDHIHVGTAADEIFLRVKAIVLATAGPCQADEPSGDGLISEAREGAGWRRVARPVGTGWRRRWAGLRAR